MGDLSPYAARVTQALEPILGRHTTRAALDLACRRSHASAGTLGEEHGEVVREVLGPILRTLVGGTKAAELLARLS